MVHLATPLLFALFSTARVAANVEKQIFFVERSEISTSTSWRAESDKFITHGIPVITLSNPVLRLRVHAAFYNSPDLEVAKQAWILLDGLESGRRYELRASFGAMQPCDVEQSVVLLSDVLSDDTLKSHLQDFLNYTQRSVRRTENGQAYEHSAAYPLLYRIVPKANYFTADEELMEKGHVVDFEFTLDPFRFNLFPASLTPTAIYVAVVSCLSLLLSTALWRSLQYVAELDLERQKHKSNQSQNKDD